MNSKDYKMMFVALIVTFAAIVGFAAWQGGGSTEVEPIVAGDVQGISVEPENYDMGEVQMKNGVVTKEYIVKNTTDKSINLKKIATSCMCTLASVKVGDKESKKFGMEGHTDKNPPINMEIPAGGTAIVKAEFDPAAHGPQGVGSFDRTVWLTFSDPGGIKELKFSGTVIN